MHTIRSAQRSKPAVTTIRALGCVPADRKSNPGVPLKMRSAVRLRRRFRLQTKRTLMRLVSCLNLDFLEAVGSSSVRSYFAERVIEYFSRFSRGNGMKLFSSFPSAEL